MFVPSPLCPTNVSKSEMGDLFDFPYRLPSSWLRYSQSLGNKGTTVGIQILWWEKTSLIAVPNFAMGAFLDIPSWFLRSCDGTQGQVPSLWDFLGHEDLHMGQNGNTIKTWESLGIKAHSPSVLRSQSYPRSQMGMATTIVHSHWPEVIDNEEHGSQKCKQLQKHESFKLINKIWLQSVLSMSSSARTFFAKVRAMSIWQ